MLRGCTALCSSAVALGSSAVALGSSAVALGQLSINHRGNPQDYRFGYVTPVRSPGLCPPGNGDPFVPVRQVARVARQPFGGA